MLSTAAFQKIDQAIAKYPNQQKRSAVMAALAIAQNEIGWLPKEAMQAVADYLEIPAIAVQEVATFYSMYHTKPSGQYTLTLCTNLPCLLSGAEKAADHLKSRLGIDFGQITKDRYFALKEGECMGACGDAPVLLVNNQRMCCSMNNQRLDELLDELQAMQADKKS